MRLRRFQLVLFAAAALAGTAAGCGGSQKSAKAGYVTVCTEEARTGSLVGRTRCERRYDREERARRDQAQMQHIQSEIARRKIVEEPPKPRPQNPQQLVFSPVGQSGNLGATHGQNQRQ